MIIWLILVISFILDNIFSMLIPINSFLLPLFTLMSLVIIYPFFKDKGRKYLSACFFTGMAYDLIYTDTILIHAFIFLMIGLLIINLNRLLSSNHVSVMFIGLVVVIFYRVIMYLFLVISNTVSFDLLGLLASIYNSLIANTIYILLLSIITDIISHKYKIRKIV